VQHDDDAGWFGAAFIGYAGLHSSAMPSVAVHDFDRWLKAFPVGCRFPYRLVSKPNCG
jgi:hypothetical protein